MVFFTFFIKFFYENISQELYCRTVPSHRLLIYLVKTVCQAPQTLFLTCSLSKLVVSNL